MSVENENCVISPLSSSLIQYVLGFILFILLISKSDIKGLLKTQEHSFWSCKGKIHFSFHCRKRNKYFEKAFVQIAFMMYECITYWCFRPGVSSDLDFLDKREIQHVMSYNVKTH